MTHLWSNIVGIALVVAFLTGYVAGSFFSFLDLLWARFAEPWLDKKFPIT